MIVETSRFILFDRLFIRMADSRFGKNIITYDENRDPETYVFDKLNDGLFKVKSIYFDDLDFELEDYLFEVSEHYLCQSFSAMKFRERIKSEKLKELNLKDSFFPVRRIITAGDDICFVSEGKIGIECAVEYMKALWKLSLIHI